MVLTNQLIYLVNIKTMRKIFSNYVCFSKSLNFTVTFDQKFAKLNSRPVYCSQLYSKSKVNLHPNMYTAK